MPDREKVIKGLEGMIDYFFDIYRNSTDSYKCAKAQEYSDCAIDAIALLKEHEVRELTIEEWRKWKENPRRDPICKLWENDTSPMWILSPEDVHEPALLMGKLKLFTGKPTFEQCKEVKWND